MRCSGKSNVTFKKAYECPQQIVLSREQGEQGGAKLWPLSKGVVDARIDSNETARSTEGFFTTYTIYFYFSSNIS